MKKPKAQKYTVWFDQVNAQMMTVKAATPAEAEKKAIAEWKKELIPPRASYIEDETGECCSSNVNI